jgi:hypothetical protein
MKRGTKITVFIASMALTAGSLFAFFGPRHCGHHGMYNHGSCESTANVAGTGNSTNQAH